MGLCSDLCSLKMSFMYARSVYNLGLNSTFFRFLESSNFIASVYKAY